MRTFIFPRSFNIVAIIAAMVIITSSCRKQKTTEDTGFASEHATSEQTFTDVQNIADQASSVSSGSSLGFKTSGSGCATVTKTPGMTVIDFGTTDCLCKDGRTRRGKIIVTYTGAYTDLGSVHTITQRSLK